MKAHDFSFYWEQSRTNWVKIHPQEVVESQDFSMTSLRFRNGAIARLAIGRIPVKSISITDIQMEVIGSEGIIRVRNGLGDCAHVYTNFRGTDADFDRGGFMKPMYNMPPQQLFAKDFVDAIFEKRAPAITIEDALAFVRFSKAAERSNDKKRVVDL